MESGSSSTQFASADFTPGRLLRHPAPAELEKADDEAAAAWAAKIAAKRAAAAAAARAAGLLAAAPTPAPATGGVAASAARAAHDASFAAAAAAAAVEGSVAGLAAAMAAIANTLSQPGSATSLGGLDTLVADALRHASHLDSVSIVPLPSGGWSETSLLAVGGEPAAVAAAEAMALLTDATRIASKAVQLVDSAGKPSDHSPATGEAYA